MKNNVHTELVRYADADWAGNPLEEKSSTGLCTFVGGNPVACVVTRGMSSCSCAFKIYNIFTLLISAAIARPTLV
jgi:hypothetical protein